MNCKQIIAIKIIALMLAAAGGVFLFQDDKPTKDLDDITSFFDMGDFHRKVTCADPLAQKWFDEGMQFLYGYNHDEAIRCFQKATRVDPKCPMAWWGIAYASGLHINKPEMDESQSKQAYEAAQVALKVVELGTPSEQALIRAVAKRYEWPIPEDRAHLDQAYADAMQQAYEAHADDPDIGALYAESLMNLQPWDLWTAEGGPKGRTEEILEVLEHVLAISDNHPGANHFYIHAIEASPWPEKGTPSADRLQTLVPGSGHLVHMPAHIYIRTGRYADAARSNEAAIEADQAYFPKAPAADFYNLYFLHNIHFLAYASMMEGRYETALKAARDVENNVPESFLKEHVKIADGWAPISYHVLIRFGRWEDILAESEPADFRLISRAVHYYSRGIALANLKRFDEAMDAIDEFEEIAVQLDEEWMVGNNSAQSVLGIARGMLAGELAFHEGKADEAFEALRQAIAEEDQLVYDEPPGWMQPVRHALGALLLADGRSEEAIPVYQEDLRRHPNNPWSLLGLQQAYEQSGQAELAKGMSEKVNAAWARADQRPHASCYCHPK